MLNSSQINRRLSTVNPLEQPTRSMLALLHAVEFVESLIQEKRLEISPALSSKIAHTKALSPNEIIGQPTATMEAIRDTLVSIRAELPNTESSLSVRIPDAVSAMLYVSSVEDLANALLAIIRILDALPISQ